MHEKLRQTRQIEQTLDLNVENQHGYRARGPLSINHVIRQEMSIGQSNIYIIKHEMSNTKYTWTANKTTVWSIFKTNVTYHSAIRALDIPRFQNLR